MAGASFKMDLSSLSSMLNTAVSSVGNTKELMSGIGEAFVSSTKERFDKGVDPEGNPWKKSERVKKYDGQTLVKDSHLKKSIDYESSSHAVAVGTSNEVYGAIHQFGGADAGKPEIEARPYIGINEEDIEEAKFMISEFMRGAFGI